MTREGRPRDLYRPFDHLIVQLLPHRRIAVGPLFFIVRGQEDGMPRRHPPEDLGVAHVKLLCGDIRGAQRIGADARFGRLVDDGHEVFPGIGLAHGLPQVVVDHGAAGSFGEAAHHAIGEFGVAAAATLNNPRAQLAQHVAEGKNFVFFRPHGWNMHALRIVVAFVARDGEPQSARFHALANNVLHRGNFAFGRGAALTFVAHGIIAHGRVADERADIDAELFVQLIHILGRGLPIDLDGAQNVHRDGFDIGQEFGDPVLGSRPNRGHG